MITSSLTLITVYASNNIPNVAWFGFINSVTGILILFNLGLITPIIIVNQLIRPLGNLNAASDKLARGEFNEVKLNYQGKVKELDTLFNNFKIMSEELSSVETMRFDFVSNVSHEFKTPLAAIEGCVIVLQNDELSEEEREDYFKRILTSTECLSSLVSNILLLNKLENITTVPEISEYRLDNQILQILLQQETIWNAKDIYFDLHLEEITYTGPKHIMYHVWSNLISNAIKYSHEHGKIKIHLHKKETDICFTITDKGIGMSEKDIRHIFDKFYQADTAHKKDGNGLGLAQVKKILDMTGNKISVNSKPNEGSSFIVTLSQ
ncbi:HAMP domain-containing sensor histidine kinase [Paenibacillus illinoisensis]|uniref:sensor histidine kinase n=1 Tax=Paenibacillus illinoisensis TaxID=59845 RepID=UPI00301A83FD